MKNISVKEFLETYSNFCDSYLTFTENLILFGFFIFIDEFVN